MMYLDWAKKEGKKICTKHHYRDTFNNKFNVGFFKPKKDQCGKCLGYENATAEKKQTLKEEYMMHIYNKEKSRKCKEEDLQLVKNEKEKKCMACFDFQSILDTPQSQAGVLHYSRKLAVYNFTIYDVATHEGHCYVYSEHEARKGGNEVGSFLLDFIEKKVKKKFTDFFLWSDNCTGQNKNRFVFTALMYAAVKFGINIKYSYLETGHTMNEGDSMHAVIEKGARGQLIYSFEQWVTVIQQAKITKPPYCVTKVTYDMIYDFENLANLINWKKSVVRKEKVVNVALGTNQIKQIFISKDHPNQIKYKCSFDEDFKIHVTRKCKSHVNVKNYTLMKAYSKIIGVSAAKKKDLLNLCKTDIIPFEHHEFYENLQVKTVEDGEVDDE